eukprot:TRINITY_DN1966_c0_g1_i1.p1 TRINITY_DN1966_c0_g1~~TRINITY_DN1966_c0_g1_i1.p1  ORF type:complete len:253 (+),score=30.69 TRINITY_DN1966_c0_g1_i1:226-984(+)
MLPSVEPRPLRQALAFVRPVRRAHARHPLSRMIRRPLSQLECVETFPRQARRRSMPEPRSMSVLDTIRPIVLPRRECNVARLPWQPRAAVPKPVRLSLHETEQLLIHDAKRVNLHEAVKGRRLHEVELVCEYCQERLQQCDRHGNTALHYAVKYNYKEIVVHLLHNHVDPNVASKRGWTPLHFAALYNWIEVALLLLRSGAEPIVDTHARSPVELARAEQHLEMVDILERAGLVRVQSTQERFERCHRGSVP